MCGRSLSEAWKMGDRKLRDVKTWLVFISRASSASTILPWRYWGLLQDSLGEQYLLLKKHHRWTRRASFTGGRWTGWLWTFFLLLVNTSRFLQQKSLRRSRLIFPTSKSNQGKMEMGEITSLLYSAEQRTGFLKTLWEFQQNLSQNRS